MEEQFYAVVKNLLNGSTFVQEGPSLPPRCIWWPWEVEPHIYVQQVSVALHEIGHISRSADVGGLFVLTCICYLLGRRVVVQPRFNTSVLFTWFSRCWHFVWASDQYNLGPGVQTCLLDFLARLMLDAYEHPVKVVCWSRESYVQADLQS